MTELIRQRARDDCTVCCIAMAAGLSYERVLATAVMLPKGYRPGEGTYSALQVLAALGVEARTWHVAPVFGNDGPGVRSMVLWRRPGIVSTKSLNGWGGWHDVFWDGEHVLDPGLLQTYPDDLDALQPCAFTLVGP